MSLKRKGGGTPKIIQLIRQAQGLAANPEEESILKKLTPHVPGIVTFADHAKVLPWSTTYTTVLMFADVSGFTSLCECYSSMKNAGIDQLTKTLNDYLGTIVEGIIKEEGDVLKFAGDAILSVWRVNKPEELSSTVDRVIKCCLGIQNKCGQWETDIGVTLSVKMGIASGNMTVTFIGNNEFRAYVELGSAVTDVNTAESFCKSGYIVLSPNAWNMATDYFYDYEMMPDDQHVRIISYKPVFTSPDKSRSLEGAHNKEPNPWFVRRRRTSHGWGVTVTGITAASAFAEGNIQGQLPLSPNTSSASSASSLHSIRKKSANDRKVAESIDEKEEQRSSLTSLVVSPPSTPEKPVAKPKFGKSKLKDLVKTVTAMRLDESLRLYILLPVLQKLDDNQPLEYLSEMRQVSIVFMNMVLDEDKDTTQLLQEIFEIVFSQSKAMHGCLNKVFLFDKGCTFLVIFGLPGYKHDRDCAHALYCSQKMRNILSEVAGVQRISIGVTTGATFCGVVGHKHRHEYSVIGRKANMAARLMMHYPDKVTCDDNTFQSSRLPASNFEILATKRMKGLKNVGVIREYIEDKGREITSELASIQHFPYPILGRELESEFFKMEIQKLKQNDIEVDMNHYLLSGASGIGKTRLMDHFIIMAEKEDIRVISCSLTIDNSHSPNFLTRHVMRMLLSSSGYSHCVEKEPDIMEALISEDLKNSLYLLNGILQTKYTSHENTNTKNETEELHRMLICIVKKCVEKHEALVLAVDDAQNIDDKSWPFLHRCLSIPKLLVVLSSQPAIIEKPSCEAAQEFIDDIQVRVHDLGSLDVKHTAALACQLMDVVRIPRQLEKLLKDRTQGVPYWCERLLIDMAEKEQILIVPDNGSSALYEDSIAPVHRQIRKMSVQSTDTEEDEDFEIRRINSAFKLQQTEMSTTAEMLQAWGSTMVGMGVKSQDKIAIFSPTINPEEILIPEQMKEFITARLDSMRASEQLIVKCATVLGTTISRDMIETILPNIPRVKARRSFKRLMQIGIFECANIPSGRTNILLQQNNMDPTACFCPKMEDDFDADLCNLMRFKNGLLHDTAYDVLLESQKLELHAKAAQYLDREADKIRLHIPYYMLNRDPPVNLEDIEVDSFNPFVNEKHVSTNNDQHLLIRENRVSDLAMSLNKSNRGRRRAVVIEKEAIDPLLKAVLHIDGTTQRTVDLAQRLMPYYNEIHRHWTAAKKTDRVMDNLLEAASAAIIIGDAQQAEKLMDTLEGITKNDQNVLTTIADVVLKAKIIRIKGNIARLLGQKDAALLKIMEAARLLGISQPNNKLKTWLRYIVFFFRLKAMRRSNRTRRPATQKTLEQGLCLSDLYSIYRERGQDKMADITALHQMIKITGRTCHLHQVVQAYAGTIRLFHKSKKAKFENELFTSCATRYKELSTDDLGVLSKIYTDMAVSSLDDGNIEKSMLTGSGAFEICDRINEQEIGQEVCPVVAMAMTLSCRHEEFSHFLQRFRSFTSYCDFRSPIAWFYSFCIERMLNGDYPIQSFQCCLDFATSYLKSADAVRHEFLPRYFMAMTIAVWFCRKGHWEKGQTWFDYWETYEPDLNSFLTLYAFSRKVEVMLLSLCTSRRTKARVVWKELVDSIQRDLRKLESHSNTIKGMKPRYHHLNAYFHMLRDAPFLARLHLRKASDLAKAQGNLLEMKWAQRHLFMWFSESQEDKLLNILTTKHIEEWRLNSALTKEAQLFTWPVRPLV